MYERQNVKYKCLAQIHRILKNEACAYLRLSTKRWINCTKWFTFSVLNIKSILYMPHIQLFCIELDEIWTWRKKNDEKGRLNRMWPNCETLLSSLSSFEFSLHLCKLHLYSVMKYWSYFSMNSKKSYLIYIFFFDKWRNFSSNAYVVAVIEWI